MKIKTNIFTFSILVLSLTSACGDDPSLLITSASHSTSGGAGGTGTTNSFTNSHSLTFNGSSKYLQKTSSPITAYPFSFSAWIKTSAASNQTIMSLCLSTGTTTFYELSLSNTGYPKATSSNTTAQSATSTVTANNNMWHHIAAVFSSNTSRAIYVDGTQRGTNSTSATFSASTNRISVGVRCGSSLTQYFNGNIDEVAVFTTALSASDVTNLYNLGYAGSLTGTTGLLDWYRMGDTAGDNPASTIYDIASTNHLTGSGMTSADISSSSP